jgi:signal transduction histidine kinase
VQLHAVVLNLVVNAMDAMAATVPADRVIRISVHPDVHHGRNAASVRVVDRGIGLGHVQMPRLFDAFYTTKATGMGMGLAISRTIVEAHGGRLCAESNDGVPGATFTFILPATETLHA